MDHLSFQSGAIDSGAVLVGFIGNEAISRPYLFEVFLRMERIDDLDAPLGAAATLTIDPGGEALDLTLNGIITSLMVLEQGADYTLLRLTLAPRLVLLDLSVHSRIFTDQALPDVLRAVLEANGLSSDDYELRLREDYPVQAHICQYKESDLSFVQRWMDREGIHYFFEQGPRREKLILTDGPTTHDSLSETPVRYHPIADHDVGSTIAFHSFRGRKIAATGKVVLRDYDYTKPTLDVTGSAESYAPRTEEIVVHGSRFFTSDDGARLASIRAQEVMAAQTTFTGSGVVFHLRAGYTFELCDHPLSWFNRPYLAVEVRHHANLGARTAGLARLTGLLQKETYRVDVVAIEASRPYRPRSETAWPRIYGFEAATIDGPVASDYAQIDDQGRYHVRMNFDESTLSDGKASTALRMMQPHGGNPEGLHFPLRKGTEVMVGFLGGDPDRPFVAGAVPNAQNPSPVTRKNNTRNIFHTGSDNHFEFEDLVDAQWIDIRVPPANTFVHLGQPHGSDTHYIVLNTEADCLFDIGSNQDIFVGGELHETVEKDVTETYKSTQTTDILGPQTTTVTAGVTETYQALHMTTVAKQVTEEYQTGQKTTVSNGPRLEIFGADQHTSVSGGLTDFNWTGTHVRSVGGDTLNTHDGTLGVHATSTVMDIVGGNIAQTWGTTDATFKSLNLFVAGSTTILCPSFDLHVPFWGWSGLTANWTTGLSFSLTGLNLSAYVMSIGATGVNVSDQGLSLSVGGPALTINGISISVTGWGGYDVENLFKEPSFLICLP